MGLITVREAAKRLGCDERTIRRWVAKGTVTAHTNVHGRTAIEESELARIKEESATPAAAPTWEYAIPAGPDEALKKQVEELEARVKELEATVKRLEAQQRTPETAGTPEPTAVATSASTPRKKLGLPPSRPGKTETPVNEEKAWTAEELLQTLPNRAKSRLEIPEELDPDSLPESLFRWLHNLLGMVMSIETVERANPLKPRFQERYVTPEAQGKALQEAKGRGVTIQQCPRPRCPCHHLD